MALLEVGAKVIVIDNQKVGIILQGNPPEIFMLEPISYGIIDQLFEKEVISPTPKDNKVIDALVYPGGAGSPNSINSGKWL